MYLLQEDLALEIGLSQRGVSFWEIGRNFPSDVVCGKIARLLVDKLGEEKAKQWIVRLQCENDVSVK